MWYASNREKTKPTKTEKEMCDAQRYLKWGPWIALAAAALLIFGAYKTAQHPTVENLLEFGVPVGIVLKLYAAWSEARTTVKGLRHDPAEPLGLLGIMLAFSGQSLAEMWHVKDMAMFIFVGFTCLMVIFISLCLLAWELVRVHKASQRKRQNPYKAGGGEESSA